MERTFVINNQEIRVQNYKLNGPKLSFSLNGKDYHIDLVFQKNEKLILDDGSRLKAFAGMPNADGDMMVLVEGIEAKISNPNKINKKISAQQGSLISPMPGKIFKVIKNQGDKVSKGEVILVLEAMKMEHPIRSDKDGTVVKIAFAPGEMVQGGVLLAEVKE